MFAADTYYFQHQFKEAEALFRKATEVEPLNAQAWRFLADSLVQQDRRAEADAALLGAIASHPSQLSNWDRLGWLRAKGTALRSLGLQRKSGVHVDDKKTIQIWISDELKKTGQESPDYPVWLAYAVAKVSLLTAFPPGGEGDFRTELDSWRKVCSIMRELQKSQPELPRDPALKQLLALDAAGQLEPAIYILMYREIYRPDFEKWKTAHPTGVADFINAYGLRP